MKIEAVIVCVNYSDFLEYTLPNNIEHLDYLVVVTSPEDKKTQALCSRYSVECVVTTEMYAEGAKFNKGRAINVGLAHLKGLDWVIHLDADTLLPHMFRNLLARAPLEKYCIYGVDRLQVFGYEHWIKYRHKRIPGFAHKYFVEPPREFPVGARIIHSEYGWTPLGFFQMWNRACHKKYPVHQATAEHTDVLFAILWERKHRVLLPEIFVYHLDSLQGPAPMGANWNGRTTPLFGPTKVDK